MMIALQWNPFPIHHPGAHHGGEVDGGSNHNVICQDVGVTRWAKVLAIYAAVLHLWSYFVLSECRLMRRYLPFQNEIVHQPRARYDA